MAALKPPTPLLTPNRGALKPASPLRPKNAPKTPISHPQRRWRFQSRLGRHPQRRQGFQSRLDRHPQRRQGFQSHTSTSAQRRRRFQTTAHLADRARLRYPWAEAGPGRATSGRPTLQTSSNQRDSNRLARTPVTNVVKPTRFTSPREDPCYKRRQSEPKNRHFQRKIPRIDDVCNNTHQSTPKTQHARPPMTPTGSGGAWPGFETTHRSATRPRWCGGRRRDRRARLRCPWAVAGPGRASRRCTEQHQRPHPTGVEGAGGHGRASRRSAERSEAA